MKATIITNDAPVVERAEYPCLKRGVHTGQIALFTGPKTGMILEGKDDTKACRAHQTPFYFGTKWKNEHLNWELLPSNVDVVLNNG